jgi:triacylglycerol lipase
MHDDVRKKIAAMGPVFSPDILGATRSLFAPLVRPFNGVRVTRDVAYGDDARQKLDVYRPDTPINGLPILLHVPPGGFVAGDKRIDETFFANLGGYFASNDVLCVVANYRLAPQHAWPAGAEDVGAMLAWLKENAAKHGGDPTRIFAWGLSAGATHLASYLFDPSLHPSGDPGLAGAILTSGFYRVTKAFHSMPNIRAYFGAEEATAIERSPIRKTAKSKVPLFLSVTEYDPAPFAMQTLELASTVCELDGKCPSLFWLSGHNHASPTFSINTPGDAVGPYVMATVRSIGSSIS